MKLSIEHIVFKQQFVSLIKQKFVASTEMKKKIILLICPVVKHNLKIKIKIIMAYLMAKRSNCHAKYIIKIVLI